MSDLPSPAVAAVAETAAAAAAAATAAAAAEEEEEAGEDSLGRCQSRTRGARQVGHLTTQNPAPSRLPSASSDAVLKTSPAGKLRVLFFRADVPCQWTDSVHSQVGSSRTGGPRPSVEWSPDLADLTGSRNPAPRPRRWLPPPPPPPPEACAPCDVTVSVLSGRRRHISARCLCRRRIGERTSVGRTRTAAE